MLFRAFSNVSWKVRQTTHLGWKRQLHTTPIWFASSAAVKVAAGVASAGAAATGVYFTSNQYDVYKARRMFERYAGSATQFDNIGNFVTIVNQIKKEAPNEVLREGTFVVIQRLAVFFDDFDHSYVGQPQVKETLLRQAIRGILQLNRKKDGTPVDSMQHCTIEGKAGSGKTTLFRKMAPLFYLSGLADNETITILQMKDVIAGHVGGTGPLAAGSLEAALGGVIFLDEFPLMVDSLYFREFLSVFLPFLTNNPTTKIVLGGYPDAMEKALKKVDPGFERRFPNRMILPDPTGAELAQIFTLMVKEQDLELDGDVSQGLALFFTQNYPLFPHFGGDVNTLVTTVSEAHARGATHNSKIVLRKITMADFHKGVDNYKKMKNISLARKWF